MQEILVTVTYKSLGGLLAKLAEAPAIQGSPELAERVKHAQAFHQQLAVELEGLVAEQRSLREELSHLTREPGERVCGAPAKQWIPASPAELLAVLQGQPLDGTGYVGALKAIRQMFGFSLEEAKQTLAQGKTTLHSVPQPEMSSNHEALYERAA